MRPEFRGWCTGCPVKHLLRTVGDHKHAGHRRIGDQLLACDLDDKAGLRGSSWSIEEQPDVNPQQDPEGEIDPAELVGETRVDEDIAPRTGVEVMDETERNNQKFYTMRDLRNGNVVKNVTVKSARRLWHYAITAYADLPKDFNKLNVEWQGDLGLLKKYKHGNRQIFDLVQREKKSHRYYFGVTEDGVHGDWRRLVGLEDE